MASKYTFSDYSPDWPAAFTAASERVSVVLADEVIEVHHVGSTAVPGLAAKPIIDLLPVVKDIVAIDAFNERMERAGYRVWGEYGLSGRRFFTLDEGGRRRHNIHVFQSGHPDIERHVAFRDYLRHRPDLRDEYAALKREAYAAHPADIAAYNDHKAEWIRRIEKTALQRRPDAT